MQISQKCFEASLKGCAWEPIFHPNYGQTRIFRRVKDQLWLFWGPFGAPRASQRWRRNLWGKPQNISERSGWSGGVICRYFSFSNSWENLIFLKIEIFTFVYFSTLSGWPCRLPDKHNFLLKLCLYFNVVAIAITWHAQSIGAPSVNKLPPKYFQFYRPDPRISLGHICKEIKLNIFALRFFSWFESSNF